MLSRKEADILSDAGWEYIRKGVLESKKEWILSFVYIATMGVYCW